MLEQFICSLFINGEYVYACTFQPIVWTDTKIDARKFHTKRELLEEIDEIKDDMKKELHGGRLYIVGIKGNVIVEKDEVDLDSDLLSISY